MKHWSKNFAPSAIKKLLITDITPLKLNENDCLVLSSLLQNEYPMDLVLSLIKDKSNQKIITTMRKQLEEGISIDQVLYPLLPKSYQKPFATFIYVLPLGQCLAQCQRLVYLQADMRKFWMKQFIPSSIMLALTYIGLILFKSYGISIMVQMSQSFHQEIGWIDTLNVFLTVSIIALSLMALIGAILSILLAIPKINQWVINHLPKHNRNLFILKASYNFSLYFNACLSQGISTHETFSVLSESNDYFVSLIAQFIQDQLGQGISFMDALSQTILDDTLIRFIELSMYTNTVVDAINAYQTSCAYLIEKKCKQSSMLFQLIAYTLIGILIICIYQVLFLPMHIMSTL